MNKSFLDKVAASPNVRKVAVKGLATSIEVAADKTVYSPEEVLRVRNYIQGRGYQMDILTIAEDIGAAAARFGLSLRAWANEVCGQLDKGYGGESLRDAVLRIIAEIEEK